MKKPDNVWQGGQQMAAAGRMRMSPAVAPRRIDLCPLAGL